ncbi:MAG: phytanoyl-CoA dioxygenase family protein [Pyrinomonadaceae bacterium]
MPRYNRKQLGEFSKAVITDGFCILPEHFAAEKLTAWGEAFAPLLENHIRSAGDVQNRGPGRYYVTLPFTTPFADADFFEDDDILNIVWDLVGSDAAMCQLAIDTPVRGSEYQDIHRDAPPLFPEWGRETPPFQLAVNFPLVAVRQENGPFEIARGTHMLSKDEGLGRIESGEIKLEPLLMQLGDVMIRDVRALHRGTPNHKAEPRPMVVIGYSRRWLLRPEVSIRIPRAALASLSERAREMLRFNPVVESLDENPETEIYQSFAY